MPCALLAHLFIFIAVVTAMLLATLLQRIWITVALAVRLLPQGALTLLIVLI